MKQENKYNKCLKLFVGSDELIDWMQAPFKIKDEAIATDAYTSIRMPLDLTENIDVLKWEGYAKEDAVLNAIKIPFNIPEKTFLLSYFKEAIEKAPLVEEFKTIGECIECDECDGEGEVEWQYQFYKKEFECPVCDGDGEIDNTKKVYTGNMVKDKNCFIKIATNVIKLEFIERIINVCELLETDKIQLICDIPNDRVVFIVDKCEITLKHNATKEKPISIIKHE